VAVYNSPTTNKKTTTALGVWEGVVDHTLQNSKYRISLSTHSVVYKIYLVHFETQFRTIQYETKFRTIHYEIQKVIFNIITQQQYRTI